MLIAGHRHPKTLALASRLGINRVHAIGLLEVLWAATAEFAPRGDIGKLSDNAIAGLLEWSGEASELVAALIECGWLDRHPKARLIVHDWAEHCPRFVRAKSAVRSHGFAGEAQEATTEASAEATTDATTEASVDRYSQPSPAQPRRQNPVPERSTARRAVNAKPRPSARGVASQGRVGSGSPASPAGSEPAEMLARRNALARAAAGLVDNALRKLDCLRYIEALPASELARAERDLRDARKARSPAGVLVSRWLREDSRP